MLAHPGFGTCHMRRHNILPAQRPLPVTRLLEKSLRCLRFRPITTRPGNAGRRLVSKPGRQFHQPLIQPFITQCRSIKLFHRPRLHHCLDGIAIEDFPAHLRAHWGDIRRQLETGRYRPPAVRRVEIPKDDGGKRLLGIPTVMDRVIQQAIAQVLSPIYEPQFSAASYGF